jgi:hypothetical protein
MSRATQVAAVVGALSILCAGPASIEAAEESPASYVSLKFEGECDAKNRKLWLSNTHSFKTIATTLRWRADGGKDRTEQLYPAPNTVREIGCAADAEILEAKFADF